MFSAQLLLPRTKQQNNVLLVSIELSLRFTTAFPIMLQANFFEAVHNANTEQTFFVTAFQ